MKLIMTVESASEVPAQGCSRLHAAARQDLCQDGTRPTTTVTPALDISRYLPIMAAVRRKPGTLVPLERAICEAAADLRRRGTDEFHGYEIARTIGNAAAGRLLTAYGTLYRALARLEKMGLLTSRWEDPAIPARENRPGRRLYTLTAPGEAALEAARSALEEPSRPRALAS